jgi:hypothetical protein
MGVRTIARVVEPHTSLLSCRAHRRIYGSGPTACVLSVQNGRSCHDLQYVADFSVLHMPAESYKHAAQMGEQWDADGPTFQAHAGTPSRVRSTQHVPHCISLPSLRPETPRQPGRRARFPHGQRSHTLLALPCHTFEGQAQNPPQLPCKQGISSSHMRPPARLLLFQACASFLRGTLQRAARRWKRTCDPANLSSVEMARHGHGSARAALL